MIDIKFINKFFEIEPDKILSTLKNVIKFQTGYIYYTQPKRLEYSFGKVDGNVCLSENLRIKNTIFGEIVITSDKFTQDDKETFKICATIISNILKDKELSDIMKMQAQALQDGYLKIKDAEQTKSKFISHISHELKTPLNSILGFSELVQLAGNLNNKQIEYLNDIKISGLQLLEMVNEILDMSRIEAGVITLNAREFEIKQAIDETINTIKPLLLKKKQTLKQEIKNFALEADYQKIQQILFNLLSNAIKYTPENGNITIKTEEKNNKAIISIIDDGIGIAPKHQEKIFKRFEQVDSTVQGSTGLGLAIVQELVKLHNGSISLESIPNKGSKFMVALPLKI